MSKIFAKKLKYLREKKGLTQEELAQDLETTKSTLGHYEQDYQEPKIEMLEKIAAYFEVTTDYLLGREKENFNTKEELKKKIS